MGWDELEAMTPHFDWAAYFARSASLELML